MTYFVYLRPCQLPWPVRRVELRSNWCADAPSVSYDSYAEMLTITCTKHETNSRSTFHRRRTSGFRLRRRHTARHSQRNDSATNVRTRKSHFPSAALRSTARAFSHGTRHTGATTQHTSSVIPSSNPDGRSKTSCSTCTWATPPLPPLSRPLLLFSSFITTEGEADDIPPAASRLWGHPRER